MNDTRDLIGQICLSRYKDIQFYINEEHKLVYASVPKSGCSSILASLSPIFNVALSTKGVHEDYNEHCIKNPSILLSSHNDRKKVLQVLLSSNYFKFTCLRDPTTRFLSGFFNKVVYLKQIASVYENVNVSVLPFCKSFANRINDDNVEEVFVDFLKYVASTDDMKRDPHFRSQYSLTLVGHVPYDKIFMLDTLEEDYGFLISKYPQLLPIPHFNKTIFENYSALKQYLGEKYRNEIYNIYRWDYEIIDRVVYRK